MELLLSNTTSLVTKINSKTRGITFFKILVSHFLYLLYLRYSQVLREVPASPKHTECTEWIILILCISQVSLTKQLK